MKFSEFFKTIAIGAMTLIAMRAASRFDSMSESISQLNINVATLITRLSVNDATLTDHEERIRSLEK